MRKRKARNSFSHRGTGLRITFCKSLANGRIVHLTLSGNSSAAMNDTVGNRIRFADWLREVADEIDWQLEQDDLKN